MVPPRLSQPTVLGFAAWLTSGGRQAPASRASLAGVGAAELVSAFVVQNGSPVLTVGALLIDLAPPWLKEAVIALFGTGDKAFLIVSPRRGRARRRRRSPGWLERVRPPLGRILIGVGGAVGVLAALTRSGNSIVDAVPSARRGRDRASCCSAG